MKQFATWNPADCSAALTLSNGNLTVAQTATQGGVRATIGKSSGKWYWEVTQTGTDGPILGVANSLMPTTNWPGKDTNSWSFYFTGQKYTSNSGVNYAPAYASGSVVGIALDMDAGTVEFFVNGVSRGVAFTGLTGTLYPSVGSAGVGASSFVANFGATSFAYTPPSGFSGLSSELGAVAATHWRVKATDKSWSAPTYGGFCFQATEIQLYESVNGTGTNVALTSTVSASSTWSGYPASRLIDGTVSYGSNWCTANGATELGWVQFILPEAKTIRSLNVAFSAAAEGNAPKSYDLQYSLDGGTTWVTAASKQVTSAVRVSDVYVSSLTNVPQLVADSASSRYWRMRATGPSWSTAYGGYLTEVSDFALYESTNQTGANLATGATASASSVYDANYPASYAIDGVVNSDTQVWVSGSGLTSAPWLQVTLPVAKTVRSAKITWLSQAGYGYLPKTFDLQYSPDEGTTWLTVVSDSTPASSTTATYYVSDFFGLSSAPVQPVSVGAATGGEISYWNGYTIHSFKSSGAFVVPTGALLVADILVVGGGASGGGGYYGGGGGAGGVIEHLGRQLSPSTYPITIGQGGAAAVGNGTNGNSGESSIFDNLIALGGGYGTAYNKAAGANGGCGGGGGSNVGHAGGFSIQTAPAGATPYGFGGGASSNYAGGGGGGAGGAGTAATEVNARVAGGPGRLHAITGSLLTYARGGQGGGASGGTTNAAVANTGNGGDSAANDGATSVAGSSGIVIIAYPTPGATDPDWDKVVCAMPMDGTNGSTSFVDLKNHTFTAVGNAKLTTSVKKMGTASAEFDGVGDYVYTAVSEDFTFPGDFAVDGWLHPTLNGSTEDVFGTGNNNSYLGTGLGGWVFALYGGVPHFSYQFNNNWVLEFVFTGSTVALNQDTYFRLFRSNGVIRLALGGTLQAASVNYAGTLTSNAYGLHIGCGGASTKALYYKGNVDDLRITKSVSRSSDLSVPTTAFATAQGTQCAPDAPTSVVASSPTVSTMSVSFTAPVNNGGSEVILYTVTSSPEGKTVTGAASPLTITGLSQGVEYTFTTTATNVVGTSVASSPSAAVSTLKVPLAPTIGAATLTGLNQATIAFVPPTDNGTTITGYTATSSVGGLTVTGTTSPLVLDGLAFGTAYQFSVVANSASGPSLSSDNSNLVTTVAQSFVTLDPAIKSAYTTLSNGNLTSTSTTGGWASAFGNKSFTSGKHYWEVTNITSINVIIGVAPGATSNVADPGYGFNAGNPRGLVGLLSSVLTTTVYGFALDLDNGALYVSQDGVWLNGGVPTSGATKTGRVTIDGVNHVVAGNAYKPTISTNAGAATLKNGSTALKYATPAGYRTGLYSLAIPQSAPVNVVATSVSATQISVAFAPGADNGAANPTTGYTVTAMPGNITASGAASPLVVNGLSPATSYTFSVKATNIDGVSAASTSSSVVSTWSVPDAPTSIITTRLSGHRVSLAYTAPVSNGGTAITGYIATSTPGGLTAQVVSGAIVITGLAEEVDYTFSVQAINSIGTGVASAPSAIYTLPKLPAAPTNVVALAVGAKTHRITFDSINDSGSPITSYTVRSNVGNFTASGSSSPILITDLTNSTTFSYTVEANTALGTSDLSASSNSLTVQPATGANTAVFATWNPSRKGSNLTLGNGNLTAVCPSNWDGVQSTVGVSSGKHYWELKVSGGWSNVMAGIGNASSAMNVYAQDTSGVEWYINNNALYPSGSAYGGAGPSSSDTVGVLLDLDAMTLAFSVNGVSRGIAKSSLPAGTWYAMVNPLSANSVTANFGSTAFSYSVPSGYRAGLYSGNIAVNAPAAPTSVLAYEPGVTTAKVSFVPPSDNGGAAITGYMAVSTPDSLIFTSATSPIQITGLKEKTGYTFQVAALNSVGIGTMSAPTAQLATAALPDAPTDLVVTDVSGHSANVECTAPAYDGGLPITGYKVTASPGGVTATGATTKVFITGLDVDADYTFTMQAVNSIGAGVESVASEVVHTDDRIVVTQLGVHSFQLVVPAGAIAAEVLHDLRAVIADYGWDVHDSAYNVFRCLNADGVTYKYLRLAVVGTTDSYATTEVYESWNGNTHVGLNRAGPNLSGQTVDDYSKTAFRLTSPTQINTVTVYCSNRWLAFGSYTDVNGVLGYNQTITAPNATRSAAREPSNTPKPTYDVSINTYAGVSGCFEFSREGLAVHGDVPCFFWTHTAWAIDDQLVLDTTNNKQAQHDAFYSTFEPRAQISHGILPSTIDQAGTKYTQVPITFTTAFVDQTDGRFLREPNAAFPPNVFNGMNQVIDLPCRSQHGFLGVVYGLKLCHPDNTLPAIFASKDFTCDSNFNIVKAGYGDLTTHWPIVTQIVKSVSQYDRTGVYHSDPVYGNLCQYTSTYYNCQGYYYGYFVYSLGNVYGIVSYDNYYTFTWAFTVSQTFDFRARFYIPA